MCQVGLAVADLQEKAQMHPWGENLQNALSSAAAHLSFGSTLGRDILQRDLSGPRVLREKTVLPTLVKHSDLMRMDEPNVVGP